MTRPTAPGHPKRRLVCVREPELDGAASGPIEQWEEKVLESLAATRFDSVPGARYQYSNIGFGTLGLALSRAAGRPFRDLVQEEIFTSLGKTVVLVTHDIREAAVFGHTITLMTEGRIVQQGSFADLATRPAGPFVTTFLNAQKPTEEMEGLL